MGSQSRLDCGGNVVFEGEQSSDFKPISRDIIFSDAALEILVLEETHPARKRPTESLRIFRGCFQHQLWNLMRTMARTENETPNSRSRHVRSKCDHAE